MMPRFKFVDYREVMKNRKLDEWIEDDDKDTKKDKDKEEDVKKEEMSQPQLQ